MGALKLYKEDETTLEDILIDEIPGEEKGSFIIDSIEKAAWAARKYIDAQHRVEGRLDQNNEFKAKIDLWSDRANSEDLSTLDYMKSILQPYAKELVKAQKKSKSLKLPEAKVVFRKSPDTVEISNEDLAISFCEATHPEVIETKKFLLKTELKKLLKKGGVIPGVRLVPGANLMFIKDLEEKKY